MEKEPRQNVFNNKNLIPVEVKANDNSTISLDNLINSDKYNYKYKKSLITRIKDFLYLLKFYHLLDFKSTK